MASAMSGASPHTHTGSLTHTGLQPASALETQLGAPQTKDYLLFGDLVSFSFRDGDEEFTLASFHTASDMGEKQTLCRALPMRSAKAVHGRSFAEACVFRIIGEAPEFNPGDLVRYGTDIMLQHLTTGKYVSWRKQTAMSNNKAFEVHLSSNPSAQSKLTISPRYAFRAEGDRVGSDDPVLFCASLSGHRDQFLEAYPISHVHSEDGVDEKSLGDATDIFEVNMCKPRVAWHPKMFRRYIANEETVLKGGDVIRLVNVDTGGALLVNNIAGQRFELHVQPREDPNTHSEKTGHDTHISIDYRSWSMWQVELVRSMDSVADSGDPSGKVVRREQRIRLRNLSTSRYLTAESAVEGGSGVCWRVTKHVSKQTVFVLRSTQSCEMDAGTGTGTDNIAYSASWCRIQHILTGKCISVGSSGSGPGRVQGAAASEKDEKKTGLLQLKRAQSKWLVHSTSGVSASAFFDDSVGRNINYFGLGASNLHDHEPASVFEIHAVPREDVESFFLVFSRVPAMSDFVHRLFNEFAYLPQEHTSRMPRVDEEGFVVAKNNRHLFGNHSENRSDKDYLTDCASPSKPHYQQARAMGDDSPSMMLYFLKPYLFTRKKYDYPETQRLTDKAADDICEVLDYLSSHCTVAAEAQKLSMRRGGPILLHQNLIRDQRLILYVSDMLDLFFYLYVALCEEESALEMEKVRAAAGEAVEHKLTSSSSGPQSPSYYTAGKFTFASNDADDDTLYARKTRILRYMQKILPKAYTFIRLSVWRNPPMQLYAAHIKTASGDLFYRSLKKHLYVPDGIGDLAIKALRAIYRNNSVLLSEITASEIESFFNVPLSLQAGLADFLAVFCIARDDFGLLDDEGINVHQDTCQKLIMNEAFLQKAMIHSFAISLSYPAYYNASVSGALTSDIPSLTNWNVILRRFSHESKSAMLKRVDAALAEKKDRRRTSVIGLTDAGHFCCELPSCNTDEDLGLSAHALSMVHNLLFNYVHKIDTLQGMLQHHAADGKKRLEEFGEQDADNSANASGLFSRARNSFSNSSAHTNPRRAHNRSVSGPQGVGLGRLTRSRGISMASHERPSYIERSSALGGATESVDVAEVKSIFVPRLRLSEHTGHRVQIDAKLNGMLRDLSSFVNAKGAWHEKRVRSCLWLIRCLCFKNRKNSHTFRAYFSMPILLALLKEKKEANEHKHALSSKFRRNVMELLRLFWVDSTVSQSKLQFQSSFFIRYENNALAGPTRAATARHFKKPHIQELRVFVMEALATEHFLAPQVWDAVSQKEKYEKEHWDIVYGVSLLILCKHMIISGFYSKQKHFEGIGATLYRVLQTSAPKTRAAFLPSERNSYVLKAKLQIVLILDWIFTMRVEKRVDELQELYMINQSSLSKTKKADMHVQLQTKLTELTRDILQETHILCDCDHTYQGMDAGEKNGDVKSPPMSSTHSLLHLQSQAHTHEDNDKKQLSIFPHNMRYQVFQLMLYPKPQLQAPASSLLLRLHKPLDLLKALLDDGVIVGAGDTFVLDPATPMEARALLIGTNVLAQDFKRWLAEQERICDEETEGGILLQEASASSLGENTDRGPFSPRRRRSSRMHGGRRSFTAPRRSRARVMLMPDDFEVLASEIHLRIEHQVKRCKALAFRFSIQVELSSVEDSITVLHALCCSWQWVNVRVVDYDTKNLSTEPDPKQRRRPMEQIQFALRHLEVNKLLLQILHSVQKRVTRMHFHADENSSEEENDSDTDFATGDFGEAEKRAGQSVDAKSVDALAAHSPPESKKASDLLLVPEIDLGMPDHRLGFRTEGIQERRLSAVIEEEKRKRVMPKQHTLSDRTPGHTHEPSRSGSPGAVADIEQHPCVKVAFKCFELLHTFCQGYKNSNTELLAIKPFFDVCVDFLDFTFAPPIARTSERGSGTAVPPELMRTKSEAGVDITRYYTFTDKQTLFVATLLHGVVSHCRDNTANMFNAKHVGKIAKSFMRMKFREPVFLDILRILIQPSVSRPPSRCIQIAIFEALTDNPIAGFSVVEELSVFSKRVCKRIGYGHHESNTHERDEDDAVGDRAASHEGWLEILVYDEHGALTATWKKYVRVVLIPPSFSIFGAPGGEHIQSIFFDVQSHTDARVYTRSGNRFQVATEEHVWVFRADSRAKRDVWIKMFAAAVENGKGSHDVPITHTHELRQRALGPRHSTFQSHASNASLSGATRGMGSGDGKTSECKPSFPRPETELEEVIFKVDFPEESPAENKLYRGHLRRLRTMVQLEASCVLDGCVGDNEGDLASIRKTLAHEIDEWSKTVDDGEDRNHAHGDSRSYTDKFRSAEHAAMRKRIAGRVDLRKVDLQIETDETAVHMALLRLLSLCSQGQVHIVEAFLQDVIPPATIMQILTSAGVAYSVKCVFLHFFHEVHLYTSPSSGKNPLRQEKYMLNLLVRFFTDVYDLMSRAIRDVMKLAGDGITLSAVEVDSIDFIGDNQRKTTKLVQKLYEIEDQIKYVFNYMLPFMQDLFENDHLMREHTLSTHKHHISVGQDALIRKIAYHFMHVLNLMLCWSGEDKQGYEVALDRCLYFETEPKADCKFTYITRTRNIDDTLRTLWEHREACYNAPNGIQYTRSIVNDDSLADQLDIDPQDPLLHREAVSRKNKDEMEQNEFMYYRKVGALLNNSVKFNFMMSLSMRRLKSMIRTYNSGDSREFINIWVTKAEKHPDKSLAFTAWHKISNVLASLAPEAEPTKNGGRTKSLYLSRNAHSRAGTSAGVSMYSSEVSRAERMLHSVKSTASHQLAEIDLFSRPGTGQASNAPAELLVDANRFLNPDLLRMMHLVGEKQIHKIIQMNLELIQLQKETEYNDRMVCQSTSERLKRVKEVFHQYEDMQDTTSHAKAKSDHGRIGTIDAKVKRSESSDAHGMELQNMVRDHRASIDAKSAQTPITHMRSAKGYSAQAMLFFSCLSEFLGDDWVSDEVSANKVTLLRNVCSLLRMRYAQMQQVKVRVFMQQTLAELGFPVLVVALISGNAVQSLTMRYAMLHALDLGILLLHDSDSKVQQIFYNLFVQPHIGRSFLTRIRNAIRGFREQALLRSEETVNWTLRYDRLELKILSSAMKFLQYLCENHNTHMQNFLRVQPNWEHPLNLATEVLGMLQVFALEICDSLKPTKHRVWVRGLQFTNVGLRTLVEIVQGPCHANQTCLALHKDPNNSFSKLLKSMTVRLQRMEGAVGNNSIRFEKFRPGKMNLDSVATRYCVGCEHETHGTHRAVLEMLREGEGGGGVSCYENHLVCNVRADGKQCRLFKDLLPKDWACPLCTCYDLERSLLQYLNGLLEGHRDSQIYRHQLMHVEISVLIGVLDFHSAAIRTDSKLNRNHASRKIHGEIGVLAYSVLHKLAGHSAAESLPAGMGSALDLKRWQEQDNHKKQDMFLSVEIINAQDELEHVFFHIPDVFYSGRKVWIQNIQKDIVRECTVHSNATDRLKLFLRNSKNLVMAVKHSHRLDLRELDNDCYDSDLTKAERLSVWFFWVVQFKWWLLSYITAVAINVILVAVAVEDTTTRKIVLDTDWADSTLIVLSWMHCVCAVLMVLNFLSTTGYLVMIKAINGAGSSAKPSNRIVHPSGWKKTSTGTGSAGVSGASGEGMEELTRKEKDPSLDPAILEGKGGGNNRSAIAAAKADTPQGREDETFGEFLRRLSCIEIVRLLYTPHIFYYMLYLVLSFLAVSVSHYFQAFHLMDIVVHFQTMRFVVEAGVSRSSQIGATVLLGIVVVYIYSVAGFVLFSGKSSEGNIFNFPTGFYDFGPDDDVAFDCTTLFDCVQKHISLGFSHSPVWHAGESIDYLTPFYDFVYVILVNVIIVSVITGIIIDTFGEMREKLEEIQQRSHNFCFICGIDRETFSLNGRGFAHHVASEHNMWSYIYLRHFLQEKYRNEPQEFTGTETYLHKEFQEHSTRIFPIGRCLTLPQHINARKRDDIKSAD